MYCSLTPIESRSSRSLFFAALRCTSAFTSESDNTDACSRNQIIKLHSNGGIGKLPNMIIASLFTFFQLDELLVRVEFMVQRPTKRWMDSWMGSAGSQQYIQKSNTNRRFPNCLSRRLRFGFTWLNSDLIWHEIFSSDNSQSTTQASRLLLAYSSELIVFYR